jgi:hypothetical protein
MGNVRCVAEERSSWRSATHPKLSGSRAKGTRGEPGGAQVNNMRGTITGQQECAVGRDVNETRHEAAKLADAPSPAWDMSRSGYYAWRQRHACLETRRRRPSA